MNHRRLWFFYSVLTMLAWGVWGALIDAPARAGFPETLGYVVWSVTMILPAVIVLRARGWKIEYSASAIVLGGGVGLLGAGGQLILFRTLRIAPAHLVFPLIALSPVVTIVLALLWTRERATPRGWAGIALALLAGVLLSISSPQENAAAGLSWLVPALLVFLAWGIQGFVISHANRSMAAESIFFYMMATGLLLAPVAIAMTDFSRPITWGWSGPGQAALIQLLNACGALLLVYAFRHGRAIIVAPLTNAGAPVITIVASLLLHQTLPGSVAALGMILAVAAATLMSLEGETPATPATPTTAPTPARSI